MVLAPKRPIRPQEARGRRIQAIKARELPTAGSSSAEIDVLAEDDPPFQGYVFDGHEFPGRWPGLWDGTPSGPLGLKRFQKPLFERPLTKR
jgi:hypothetical protein